MNSHVLAAITARRGSQVSRAASMVGGGAQARSRAQPRGRGASNRPRSFSSHRFLQAVEVLSHGGSGNERAHTRLWFATSTKFQQHAAVFANAGGSNPKRHVPPPPRRVEVWGKGMEPTLARPGMREPGAVAFIEAQPLHLRGGHLVLGADLRLVYLPCVHAERKRFCLRDTTRVEPGWRRNDSPPLSAGRVVVALSSC